MSKFTADMRLTHKKKIHNPEFICPNGFEWAKSFNDETNYKQGKTRFLIVGTLTPPDGRGPLIGEAFVGHFPGYFYCSDDNDMYMFLDVAFKNRKTKLVDLKNKFRKSWNPRFKKAIIDELSARDVAFIDVIEQAYTLPITAKNCSSDDAIDTYLCDFNAFKKVDFSDPNLKIIANSKNAKIALKHILNKLGKIHDIILVPQMLLGYWGVYPNKDALIKEWVDALK